MRLAISITVVCVIEVSPSISSSFFDGSGEDRFFGRLPVPEECLRPRRRKVWEARLRKAKAHSTNAQSATASSIPGVIFSRTTDGWLRAYASEDGGIVWEAVNAVGPVIVNGIVCIKTGVGINRDLSWK